MRPTKIQGASPLWAEFCPEAWWIRSGQAKAATPNTVVRRSRNEEREPNRIAGVKRRPDRVAGRLDPRRSCRDRCPEGPAHFVHRQPFLWSQHLGHLGGEDR